MIKCQTLVAMTLLGTLFAGCTNDASIGGDDVIKKTKSSEMFVYSGGENLLINGQNNMPGLTRAWNKSEEKGYSIPVDGKYDVWYYIRIDGQIPGEPETNLPANQYFPQTASGKTKVCDLNHGTVLANVAWRKSEKKNFPKYIWGTDGSAVQSIIVDEPTLEDLLLADENTKYDLTGYIEHKDELHFIWYACKQQATDHIWHIDGILTSKDKTDITETIYGDKQKKDYDDAGLIEDKGSVVKNECVEVDIHQQEHKDWNEIKTSIHLRDTVTAEVFLPLDYVEQADDFNIRAGIDFEYITEKMDTKVKIGDKEYTLEASITHEEKGIRIIVKPNAEALEAAQLLYRDGITYEIHSYVTYGIPQDVIWQKLSKSTVTVTPQTYLYGQITSAYNDERIEIK